jgi:hypothetical protein
VAYCQGRMTSGGPAEARRSHDVSHPAYIDDVSVILGFLRTIRGAPLARSTPFGVVAQYPPGVLERVIDGGVRVVVTVTFVGAAVRDELGTRDREIDAHAVVPAVMLVAVRGLDDDGAADDVRSKRVQLLRAPADIGFERVGSVDVAERDARRECHGGLHSCDLVNLQRLGRQPRPPWRRVAAGVGVTASRLLVQSGMATKAEQFRDEQQKTGRTGRRPSRSSQKKPKKSSWSRDKAHARSKATHALENSAPGKQRSRKSTRGSANRSRPDAAFNITEETRKGAPDARARRAQAKATKVRGRSP